MLRRYRGLKSGYGVTNKNVSYEPFKLQLHFREAPPDENCVSTENAMPCKNTPSVNSSMLLVISATPVKAIYKSELRLNILLLKSDFLFFFSYKK